MEATYSQWHCDCLASKEVQTWENKWWQRGVECTVSLLLLCGSWGGWGMGGERRAAVTWVKVSHTATSAARRAGQDIQLVGANKKFIICDLFPLYALFVILLVRTKEMTELKYDQAMVCVYYKIIGRSIRYLGMEPVCLERLQLLLSLICVYFTARSMCEPMMG